MTDASQKSRSRDSSDGSSAFWRTQEMLLIQQIMGRIGKGLQIEQILREMLQLMSEMLGLNRGRIVLFDADTGAYRIRYSYGLTKEGAERGAYALGEGITGRVIAREQLIVVQDIDREPAFLARAVERRKLPEGPVSFIALPVRIDQKTVGALACHRIRHRNRALSDDMTILRIFATLVGQILELNANLEKKTRALEQHNDMLARALETRTAGYGIIGTSPLLLKAIAELEQVASANAPVLLLGESGTGKELFARALHLASPRRDKPFVKVNCAAIPDALFESELFGHERGSFTGATEARAGWFEQANGGSIFLDEIGELPLTMQTKLLRTLQESTITRLGGKREIKVDMRIVAATNKSLQAEASEGRFRPDLYYRLNVIPIQLPSLSERRGDIPALVMHFVNRANVTNQRNVNLTADAIERLKDHRWPGNIRQLSNLIERVVLLANKAMLTGADIELFLAGDSNTPTGQYAGEGALSQTPAFAPPFPQMVRPYLGAGSHSAADLQRAVLQCGGNKSRAAQMLGLTARQLAYRWRKCGLDSA
ncbi:Sigma-54-dependent Fis family transcriptional regulator [Methylocella tundrae]|uniref:Sigma-54-dependent Fis family transcriptional regulator n=1 Tax=Methylocella tundrae TaxID=227605 RepID=A0A8B6M9H0_METTU|nr:sigma 54-interacting transcriptional regulator [Methylocella tundrae]VTZ25394.1 Sigma-54-dependent Fis family transcriptional regulator [Methylocella tundrae]VTZ50694.1 Sigma-54-dependent Fis family transcriptional regulator [Methylocella tundrae]